MTNEESKCAFCNPQSYNVFYVCMKHYNLAIKKRENEAMIVIDKLKKEIRLLKEFEELDRT